MAAGGEKSPIGTNAREARPADGEEGRSRPRSGRSGRNDAAQFFHHRKQIALDKGEGDALWPELPPGHDNDVHTRRQKRLVESKKFPEHPFDPIPPHRRPNLFGNSKTDPPLRPIGRMGERKHNKVPGKKTVSRLVTRCKLEPPEQPVLTRSGQSGFTARHETAPAAGERPHARPREQFPTSCGIALDRQSVPSLGAAAADNGAAAGRAHTFAEAVRPGTLDLARLICPFHQNFLCACTISVSVQPCRQGIADGGVCFYTASPGFVKLCRRQKASL